MAHCCCAGVDLVCEDGGGGREGDGFGEGEGAGWGACCEGCRGGEAVSGMGSFVSMDIVKIKQEWLTLCEALRRVRGVRLTVCRALRVL